MEKVVGLGAGGHAKVVIEALRLSGGHDVVGLLDLKPELWDTEVLGVPVLGGDGLLAELNAQGVGLAFVGVGGVGDTAPRRRLYELALDHGFQIIRAIHPRSVLSPSAQLGEGPTVLAGAVINAEAVLGDNVIVNTGSIVEHDCVVGSHVHVATGAVLAASVTIGDGAHIGAGSTIRQGISIGQGALVGAGAAVVKDVAPFTVVTGVPATVLEHREAGVPGSR